VSAQAAAAPVAVHRALPPEEAARANFYALLARLLNAPPDGALLHRIAGAGPLEAEGEPELARAWRDLIAASSVMDADAAAQEHESLFATMGKPLVSIYAGAHAGAPAVAHPRVRIRADLVALGLAPRPGATEPEDHLGGLLEAMRVLVAGGAGREPATLADQRRFFQAHVEPAAGRFFAALARAELANYYRKVAGLGAAFVALEAESFSLD
jgi:TorA maturation chaperone TorD